MRGGDRNRERDRDRDRGRDRGDHNRGDHSRGDRDRDRERGGGGAQGVVVEDKNTIVRDKLVKLCDGEAASPTPERVQEVASFLQQRAALDAATAKVILECASAQCSKVPMYAALVGLLNARHPPFGQAVLDQCAQSLRAIVEPNVLRFMAELRHANVLSMRSLTQLMCRVKEEGPEELLLVTLPWAGWGVDPEVVDALLSHQGGDAGKADSEAALLARQYLRSQVQALRANDWECDTCIARVPVNWATVGGRPHELDLPLGAPLAFAMPRISTFRCFGRQDSEVTECYVLDVCQNFAPSLSLAVDRLLQMMPVKFRYDWVMVETLLGQLLSGAQDALFFHALLSMMLRNNVKLAGLYFRAVDALFKDVGTLDPDARQRFVEWFAVHLSNFGFKWEWSQWAGTLEGLADDHPRVLFVRAVLGRCVRLSYWARVEKSLPPTLAHYMPPYPKPAPAEVDASGAQHEQAAQHTLLTVLREGTTFSLLRAGLRKHGAELRKLAATDDAKLKLLRLLGQYWAASEGHRLLVADLLLSTMVVDQMAIMSWVFSEHSAGSLISYAPWEILHMAVGKTAERTVFLQQQVAEKKEGAEAKLEAQLREQKDLFLTTFQRFVIVLETYLAQAQPAPGQENSWFHAVLAQMVAFGNRYRDVIRPFVSTLRSFVFSDDCDERIRAAFQKITLN